MAEKEISLMRMIGRGLSGLQLVCLLCLRATLAEQRVSESRSGHVTAQPAKQDGTLNTNTRQKNEQCAATDRLSLNCTACLCCLGLTMS